MQAGDIIESRIDSFNGAGGFSVVTVRAVEGKDAAGNPVLLPGPKNREGIGRGDFRADPNDPESDIDEAAYQAKLDGKLAEVFGDIPAKVAEHNTRLAGLRQEWQDSKAQVQANKNTIAALREQLQGESND